MVEILVVAAVSAGAAVAMARATNLPGTPAVLLSPVVGLAGYVSVVAVLAATVGRAHPPTAAAVTVVGLAGIALQRRTDRTLAACGTIAGVALAAVGAAGWIASVLNATRLTPDSMSYLAVANIFTEPNAIERLASSTIETRNASTGALHTLGAFDGRPYAEVVTPVTAGFGTLAMLWFLHCLLTHLPTSTRRLVLGATAVFCALAGRPLYDAFFINSHGPVMVWLFAVVAAGYLLITNTDPDWAFVAAIVAPAILIARPEGPILVALGLLPVLTVRSTIMRRRWLLMVPTAVVAAAWFGAAAVAHPGLVGLSPSQPVLPAMVIVMGLIAASLLATYERTARMAAALPWALAVTLAGLFLLGTIRDAESTAASIQATATNLTAAGGWGMTWPALACLFTVAIACRPIPNARSLVTPILSFTALFWASPVLRDGGYRVGTGDSGNRMLAHIFLVWVFYVVLTISGTSVGDRDGATPSPGGGTASGETPVGNPKVFSYGRSLP